MTVNNIKISTVKNVKELEILKDRQVFNYTYDQAEINSLQKNFLLADSLYLFAKDEENFAGFCAIDRNWWENNFFFIREILIDLNFRNLNIGSDMMSQCINHAKSLGATGVVTETAFDNIPMQNLCKKYGFEKWNNPQWTKGITFKLIF